MAIELNPQQQRVIDLAIRSGAFHNTDEVIDSALSMLAEDIEDGMVSKSRSQEPARQRTGQELIDACAKVRGLLTDEEVDTLFSRNPSMSRPVYLE